MKISSAKTENGKVSCKTAEGSMVHININQRSSLDCLLDTIQLLRSKKESEQKTKPSRVTSSAGHLGFGVAFISLGVVSIMLAVIIDIVRPDMTIFYNQIHWWVGLPFFASGTLNLVAYKFPNKYWMVLAFISLLVNCGVSVAGMRLTVYDIQYRLWDGPDEDTCYNLRSARYDATTAFPRYDNNFELERCKAAMQQYKTLQWCMMIMTLLILIWGLCLTILSVGFGVKSFCCSRKLEKTNEKDALIKSNPSDDIIVA